MNGMNGSALTVARSVFPAGAAHVELVCGNALRLLDLLEDGVVDVTVTSPPYNLGIDYVSGFDDGMAREDYLAWCRSWLALLLAKTNRAGSLFLNVSGKPTSPWGPHEVALEARAAGWRLQNTLYWIKSAAGWDAPGDPATGHVKPINSERFVNDACELVLHLTPAGETKIDRLALGVPYADKSNLRRGTRGKHGDLRCRGNAWLVPYETISSKKDRPHPATFPPELAEWCFRLHGLDRIRSTVDPFSGLGSTARAAVRLGLNHLGIELGKADHDEACRRVATEVEVKRASER